MAAFETYDQGRQAEDVQDTIYIISPVDNPVASMSRTLRATGKLHEWTEDVLQPASKNARVEGADYPGDSSVPVVELNNSCQIQSKGAEITGTLEDVDKYGRDSEMSYQLELRYGELANDEELAIVGAPLGSRQTQNVGASGVAREMASLHNQLSNDVIVDAATSQPGSTPVSTIPELEADLLNAHLKCYDEGGNPSYLFTPPALALHIGNFAYAAGRQRDIRNEKQLVNCIDLNDIGVAA